MRKGSKGKTGKAPAAGEVLLCSYGLYPEQITCETLGELRASDVIFLDSPPPRFTAWLGTGPRLVADAARGRVRSAGLREKALAVAREAAKGQRVAVVSYGNPGLLSVFPRFLAAECGRLGLKLRTLSAVSSFDSLINLVPGVPLERAPIRLVCPSSSCGRLLDREAVNIVMGLEGLGLRGDQQKLLRAFAAYPAGHLLALVTCRAEGVQESVKWVKAGELSEHLKPGTLERVTLYVPPAEGPAR